MANLSSHSAIWGRIGNLAVSGDRTAMGELLQTYRPLLLSMANQRLRGPLKVKVGASDLVQQTCEDAIVGISDVRARDGHQLWGWLSSLLSKNVSDAQRRFIQSRKRSLSREEGTISEMADPINPENCAEQRLLVKETADQLNRALMKLPMAHREILQWRYLESRSCEEIAVVLRRSEAAVRMMVNRALKKMASHLPQAES